MLLRPAPLHRKIFQTSRLMRHPWSDPCDTAPAFLVRDNDCAYGAVFTRRVRSMGIRDRPIAPRSPWQNGYVERAIGSIRRECLDHMIVWSEAHLRRVLKEYTSHYNAARTHLGLQKDAPHRRPIERLAAASSLATSWADFTIN